MQSLVKHTLFTFLIITIITSLMALIGVGLSWVNPEQEFKYLHWLLGICIVEIVSIIISIARKGFKYLPETRTNKTPEQTQKFMEDFISSGSSATIVSNRLSWLSSDESLIAILNGKIEKGIRIEIITPKEASAQFREKLKGAHFFITNDSNPPEARFTLVNADRSGAEKLAIARGTHPDHEITILDSNSGPQIIAMAKDIITKSKRS